MAKKIATLFLVIGIMVLTQGVLGEGRLDVPKNVKDYADIAEYNVDDFAEIKTQVDDFYITLTLSKPVDSLYANWMGYGETPEELSVSEDLTANFFTLGHKYQVGTKWSNAYWTPFIWEEDHDVYFSFEDDQGQIDDMIDEIWNYMRSKEYLNSDEAQELISWAKDVMPEVVVKMPQYAIYTLELADEEATENNDVKDNNAAFSYRQKNLEVFEYGTDMAVIKEAYKKWVKEHPEMEIYMDEMDGYAWGRLIGRDYFESEGAPNYAYITLQGDFKVVYGRNGSIRYFEKTVENVDLFGIGPGTAIFRFARNNVGWYPARVRVEFESGDYQAITANYDGNGKLYGIGFNYFGNK